MFWGCGERAPKGQPVVIDYKSGAAGNIASEYVARAKPIVIDEDGGEPEGARA